MTLLGPFDRPVTLLPPEMDAISTKRPFAATVEGDPSRSDRVQRSSVADERRVDTARFLTAALLGDSQAALSDIDRIEAVVDELVVVWSPSLYVTSRHELVAELFDRDDAITEITIDITGEAMSGPRIFIEWRARGRFENPGFLNDDLLIEPSHSEIQTAGVLVCGFRHDRVSQVSCFYDGGALLEQLLMPPVADSEGSGPSDNA